MEALPAGTVTFLFTDVEGSTRLLQRQPERYGDMLSEHRALLRRAVASHGGREIGTQGDSFFIAFVRARDALAAAVDAQQALGRHVWPDGLQLRVRMGIHTGEPTVDSEGYVGLGVHRAARICSAGHGGQVLLSDATRQLIEDELPVGVELRDLGLHRLKDIDRPEHLFQALIRGMHADFPPLTALTPLDADSREGRTGTGRAIRLRPRTTNRTTPGSAAQALRTASPEPGHRALDPAASAEDERGRDPEQRAFSSRARRRLERAALAAVAAGCALAVAALLAALLRDKGEPTPRTMALDLAKDSVAGFRSGAHRPDVAVPLPGRPTGMASAGGRVFVTTVDSAALTEVDGRSRSIIRTVPLALKAADVAVAAGRVYVIDPRGIVEGFRIGYDRPSAHIVFRRRPVIRGSTAGARRSRSTSLAAAGGVLWATDGSSLLRRIDPGSGRVSSIAVGRSLDGVVTGEDAVWAFSARTASVVRVDPRNDRVTDIIPIVTRSGTDAPFPIAMATTPETVWVLNGNTATVTRIDAHQRGVVATVPIGMDRAPRDIAASGRTVWTANADGSLSRLEAGEQTPSSLWVGQSLGQVSADGGAIWVTASALDQQLPGGRG
jgi:class 3 adenylate cyclase